MTIRKVLLLLLAGTFVVNGDFYLNLYDRDTKKYLSVIEYDIDVHYIKASKDEPDMFCKFNFVTSELAEGKVSFQTIGGNYFNLTAGNYIQPKDGKNMTAAEFEFIMESDPQHKQGARIALKAINGLYWSVTDKYVKAESSKPVYFNIYPID